MKSSLYFLIISGITFALTGCLGDFEAGNGPGSQDQLSTGDAPPQGDEPKPEEPTPEEPTPEEPKPEEPKPEEPKPEEPAATPLEGDYYVSPSGSDSNNGSKSKPFKTLQKAVSVMSAGDIIVVRDGVYRTSDGDYGLWINKAGTSSAWIRIVAENRGKALIDGNNNSVHYGVTFGPNARYISVEGFEIKGYIDGGFFSNSGAQHINMYGNIIHHIGRRCTDSQYGQSGIFIGSKSGYHTIDSNIFHTIGRFGPGENGCKPGNEYWKNHDHGIYMKTGNVNIINNVFNGMDRGWAIHAYDNDMANVNIVNNTFYGPNPNRVGHILATGSNRKFTNWLIQNNIFEDPNGKALSFSCDKVSGFKVYGNITTSTLAAGDNCFDAKSNRENTSAQLRAPASGDFSIPATSRACDIALTENSPEVDIVGYTRPAGSVCAGAYQPR